VDVKQLPGILTTLWVGVLNNDAVSKPAGESESNQPIASSATPPKVRCWWLPPRRGRSLLRSRMRIRAENEVPFDSERKRMITIHDVNNPNQERDPSPFYDERHKNWDVIAVKGAPDIVLTLCSKYQAWTTRCAPLTDEMRNKILAANDAMTKDALRVLGFAYRVEPDVPNNIEEVKTENLKRTCLCRADGHDRPGRAPR
jgi:Ca2+-transporting ATPase